MDYSQMLANYNDILLPEDVQPTTVGILYIFYTEQDNVCQRRYLQ